MRSISRALLPGVLGFAVAVLVAACGGSAGLLSANQATSLDGQLNAITNAIDSGACGQATSNARVLDDSVSHLGGVDRRIVSNLQEASQALLGRVGSDCRAAQTTTSTTPTKTTTTPTNTTPTTPTNATQSTQTSTGSTSGTTPGTGTNPATTGTNPGTTTGPQSGGAGLGGGAQTGTTPTTSGSGGAAAGGNGNGQ